MISTIWLLKTTFFRFVCFITEVYLNFFDRIVTDLVKHNLVLSVDVQKNERKK